MGTAAGPQPQPQQTAAEAEPRSGGPAVIPTPRPIEMTGFLNAMAAGTLRGTLSVPTWSLAADGSPVAQGAFNPTQQPPTWT